MQTEEFDLGPYLKKLADSKGALFGWLVVGAIIAAGITAAVKPMYRVNSVLLLPPGGAGNPLAQLISNNDSDPLEVMKGILESKSTLDALSRKTGLKNKDLDKMLSIQTKKDQNQLILSCTDWSEKLATDIVNGSVEALKDITDKGQLSLSDLQTKTLEQDLQRRTKQLASLEDKLLHYSSKTKTPVDPTNPFGATAYVQKKKEAEYELKMIEQQIKVALDAAQKMSKVSLKLPTAIPNQEKLRERLVSQQYDLDTKMTQLGPESADVKNLQAQIKVTKDLIESEVAAYVTAANSGIDPGLAQLYGQEIILKFQNDYLDSLAKAAPTESLNASRIFREIAMQETALKYIREKLEEAKVNGLINPTQWSVLVPTYTEDKPANKRFGFFGSIGAFVGLFVGAVAVLWKDARLKKASAANRF